MVETQTTREEWAQEGPFEPFEIARSRTRNVPDKYIKSAQWGIVDGDKSYHAQSPVEGDNHFYPVEFVPTCVYWVEICWHENLEQGGHWEAFRIAGPDLGLNITPEDVDRHIAQHLQLSYRGDQAPENTTPSCPSTPSEHSSHPSIIQIHELSWTHRFSYFYLILSKCT